MSKNVIVPNVFKNGEKCKGQSKSRKHGNINGIKVTGGVKIPFSFIANVNGVELILGLNNNMFMLMTDEQKEAMKHKRKHARTEHWLDAYIKNREETQPLFKCGKPQKFKRTPVTKIRKESPRPYFNQRAYQILLKIPDIKMNQARKLASNRDFAEAFIAKVKQVKSK